ncbi:MAG: PD-(D/E)XK nuclease family protein [Halanaeroarchaeum sp.]
MPISRTNDLDAVYSAVADYDLVLVPDAAYASALNRRLDHPHFGTFATTPRRLAAGRREHAEDRTAFLAVIDRTDHDWRAVAYAIGNVLQCWEHQGTLDAIFEYDAYVDATTRDVVEVLRTLDTTSKQLSESSVPADQSVAVVGESLMTPLERTILTPAVDRFEVFTDAAFDYPPFHVFDSKTDIVEALLDTVTPENADRVGVVLDGDSQYSTLVESAFEAADIPFYGGPGFADDPHHRAFVRLLRLGVSTGEVTVEDVQPVLAQMDIAVPVDHRHKRLAALEDPSVAWLQEFMDALPESTFADALQAYTAKTGQGLQRFDAELRTLGLAETLVTESAVDRMAVYLQTYEVPVDREDEGVLLADATSSASVDRPVVFYLGMDEGWTHAAPQRPWVDTEAQFDRYLGDFQRLLQSGEQQYYLVQDAAGGEPVTPSLYFGDLLEASFERFSDLDSEDHRRRPRTGGSGFDHQPLDIASKTVETLSQSSLNTYINSPRAYLFDTLLDSPDQQHFVEGSLFHDFAEFYANHPETLTDADLDDLVDFMHAEASPFMAAHAEPLKRREYRIGLETLMAYLDANPPEETDVLTPTSRRGENAFAQYFDIPVDSPLTEHDFENFDLAIKGTIDLVAAPDHLVDYKSSSQSRATQIVTQASIDPPADTPNYQAALYLTHFRTVSPETRIEFSFVYFLDVLDDVIAGEADLDDAVTTVTYYPVTFEDFLTTREAYETLLDGPKDCVATFEALGYDAYRSIMNELAFPATTDKEELRASEFATRFTEAVQAETPDDLDVEKGVDQAIRELNGVRRRAFFREELDAFEAFVTERREELNRRLAGAERFPVAGPAGEPNYRRIDNRDLLLEGRR